MEDVVVKMSDEHYEAVSDMKKAIKYIAAEGKNAGKERLLRCRGRGVSSNASKVVEQMIAVQRAFGKSDKRRMYHLIVSFTEDMRNESVIQQAADTIADMLFENHQVFYGIHISKNNWHIHYAINAVSYTTGKKWHQSKKEFQQMKGKIGMMISEIC
ncbi:MAG: relaxase/mobilization nuclease domain-containing protein [Lachnospiraceae bacterium]|nr:relaxase/mobilization nuclease domain-containing protein [Lachnospiraceae bacterium]